LRQSIDSEQRIYRNLPSRQTLLSELSAIKKLRKPLRYSEGERNSYIYCATVRENLIWSMNHLFRMSICTPRILSDAVRYRKILKTIKLCPGSRVSSQGNVVRHVQKWRRVIATRSLIGNASSAFYIHAPRMDCVTLRCSCTGRRRNSLFRHINEARRHNLRKFEKMLSRCQNNITNWSRRATDRERFRCKQHLAGGIKITGEKYKATNESMLVGSLVLVQRTLHIRFRSLHCCALNAYNRFEMRCMCKLSFARATVAAAHAAYAIAKRYRVRS
ncbi:unnamed protein product, partial [Trichogramma brassicae]